MYVCACVCLPVSFSKKLAIQLIPGNVAVSILVKDSRTPPRIIGSGPINEIADTISQAGFTVSHKRNRPSPARLERNHVLTIHRRLVNSLLRDILDPHPRRGSRRREELGIRSPTRNDSQARSIVYHISTVRVNIEVRNGQVTFRV